MFEIALIICDYWIYATRFSFKADIPDVIAKGFWVYSQIKSFELSIFEPNARWYSKQFYS